MIVLNWFFNKKVLTVYLLKKTEHPLSVLNSLGESVCPSSWKVGSAQSKSQNNPTGGTYLNLCNLLIPSTLTNF